jgi:GntR family transcriptional regulator, transcriptional repressor for pyruvate dehydrogenase complex
LSDIGKAKVKKSITQESERVRKRKIHERVSKQIRCKILKKLKPGDKLPAIRTMAEMFGVTRFSVREAIRSLELLGVVNASSGGGSVLRSRPADRLANPVANFLRRERNLLGDLLDFRKILEPALAAVAAKRASPQQIGKMEEILRRQEDKLTEGETAMEEAFEFHFAIAAVSENTIAINVLQVLMELLFELQERSFQMKGRPQKSLAGHRRIVHAIERHKPDAAKAAMGRHIHDIEEILLRKFQQKSTKS